MIKRSKNIIFSFFCYTFIIALVNYEHTSLLLITHLNDERKLRGVEVFLNAPTLHAETKTDVKDKNLIHLT